jgi:hypothetical protein
MIFHMFRQGASEGFLQRNSTNLQPPVTFNLFNSAHPQSLVGILDQEGGY